MSAFKPHYFFRDRLRQSMQRRSQPYNPAHLTRPAVVFSPHFDDETLGCGGLILQKRNAGANLHIVFMTDGSKSHSGYISENTLSRLRTEEGYAAAAALGVDAASVHCLQLEETRLADGHNTALSAVLKILQSVQPQEIFLPYRREPELWSGDHRAATAVVLSAVRHWRQKVALYEYPVWFWFHFPWVGLPLRRGQHLKTILANSLALRFGSTALADLRCALPIADVLPQKRLALSQYSSQISRLLPETAWPTLQDMAGGEFLETFFQPVEYFRQSIYQPE